MAANTYNKKKIKLVLTALILVAVITLVGIFSLYRRFSAEPEKIISTLAEKADISMNHVHHIATRNGRKEWALDASSARLSNADKQAFLENVRVTFYMKDLSEVQVEANQGILQYRSNDIEVNGHVIVKRGPFLLETEKMNYFHKKQLVVSSVPVRITGNTVDLRADAMTHDLNKNQTELTGNVRGILSENISL